MGPREPGRGPPGRHVRSVPGEGVEHQEPRSLASDRSRNFSDGPGRDLVADRTRPVHVLDLVPPDRPLRVEEGEYGPPRVLVEEDRPLPGPVEGGLGVSRFRVDHRDRRGEHLSLAEIVVEAARPSLFDRPGGDAVGPPVRAVPAKFRDQAGEVLLEVAEELGAGGADEPGVLEELVPLPDRVTDLEAGITVVVDVQERGLVQAGPREVEGVVRECRVFVPGQQAGQLNERAVEPIDKEPPLAVAGPGAPGEDAPVVGPDPVVGLGHVGVVENVAAPVEGVRIERKIAHACPQPRRHRAPGDPVHVVVHGRDDLRFEPVRQMHRGVGEIAHELLVPGRGGVHVAELRADLDPSGRDPLPELLFSPGSGLQVVAQAEGGLHDPAEPRLLGPGVREGAVFEHIVEDPVPLLHDPLLDARVAVVEVGGLHHVDLPLPGRLPVVGEAMLQPVPVEQGDLHGARPAAVRDEAGHVARAGRQDHLLEGAEARLWACDLDGREGLARGGVIEPDDRNLAEDARVVHEERSGEEVAHPQIGLRVGLVPEGGGRGPGE